MILTVAFDNKFDQIDEAAEKARSNYLLARKWLIDGNFRSQKAKSGSISCLM
jgi:hypothetical protein